ncbi:MAG TPA: EscU/YscU/HrcU family type III secretion system export apparatus switch protein [Micavibrio sp.]|nr:EscU/YscU/HrcU family type III secretion system export apparatus switch protein [Micavibrio sp.]
MADDPENDPQNPFKPLNIKEKNIRQTAVALKDRTAERQVPQVVAAGRGEIAEKIMQLAFENGIKVKEDAPLAEMLAAVELDSPIPSEAFMAVAEILYYVYRANGEPNPFDAVLRETSEEQKKP